ncbi:MAG TPA: hypothetical protein VEL69_00925 [Ktedonobacteraceae bacterium]|nr:hypothetical protein [Ktedonobacteraceae bacterium]
MSSNTPPPNVPPPGKVPPDLEAQSRQSLQAVGKLIGRLTPWLFAFGSWIFGGLIAFNLLVVASLMTVGPVHPAILVSIAAFACALPLNVAGLFLLKLIQEMKEVGIDEHLLHAFQEADFPIEAYVPQDSASLQRRRTNVALCYSLGILALSLVLTLAGMTAALWYMAWWVGIIFLVMVLISQILVILVIAHSLPPTSEEEKEQKRRYKEYRALQRKGQRKAEQKREQDEN